MKSVDGLSLRLNKGQALGIAGESGCGKSVTAQSILRIVPRNGRIVGGSINFERNGKFVDLARLEANGKEMREIRGSDISMIFQEPMTSFSPLHTIGNQIAESIRLHSKTSASAAFDRTVEILELVGLPRARQAFNYYSYQLSGGQRQRALVGMALACQPRILIADEPTTAVDVTIQAQVLELIAEMKARYQMALVIITHDLAVISENCDSVIIMYLGRQVEVGPVAEVLGRPLHPYTVGLLNSVPRLGEGAQQNLSGITGVVPSPYQLPTGCPFRTRCPNFMEGTCDQEFPVPVEVSPGHSVNCFLYS